MKISIGSKALIYPSPVWCVGSYDKNGEGVSFYINVILSDIFCQILNQ